MFCMVLFFVVSLYADKYLSCFSFYVRTWYKGSIVA